MEAIEFLKEAKRKCMSITCDACRAERLGVMCPLLDWSEDEMEQLVSTIEQWSKEHQIITNAQKFKEVFGFLPDGDFIFSKDYFINAVKGPVLKWDEPYEGAEI